MPVFLKECLALWLSVGSSELLLGTHHHPPREKANRAEGDCRAQLLLSLPLLTEKTTGVQRGEVAQPSSLSRLLEWATNWYFFQAIQLSYRHPGPGNREHKDKRENRFPRENEKQGAVNMLLKSSRCSVAPLT